MGRDVLCVTLTTGSDTIAQVQKTLLKQLPQPVDHSLPLNVEAFSNTKKTNLILETVECRYIKQLVYMSDLSDFPEASAFVLLDFKGTNTKKHLVSISAERSTLGIYLLATNTMKK